MNYKILQGDNIDHLKQLPENSFDACITDPPYGMDMEDWDSKVPESDTWQEVLRVLKPGAFCLSFCSTDLYHRMASNMEQGGFRILDMINWIVTTKMSKNNRLKPAHEPIAVAQKPFKGTIKSNFEEWGVGQINIEKAKVPWDGKPPTGWLKGGSKRRVFGKGKTNKASKEQTGTEDADPTGRYPSNIIGYLDDPEHQKYFYAPRVTRKEKGEYNDHPTVKPISLMRYLTRVYSPLGGQILDPFNGTGTTGIGSLIEGRSYTGIELSEHYAEISKRRINDYLKDSDQFSKLFDYE